MGWNDVGWELAQKRGVGWDEWVGMDGKGVGYGMVWYGMGWVGFVWVGWDRVGWDGVGMG